MKVAIVEPIGLTQDSVKALAKEILKDKAEVVYYDFPCSDEEKIQRSQTADAVIIANKPYKENILSKCPNLKFLSVAFTGVDHVDMDYCHAHNILVANSSGYANEAVSELVIGMCINLYRKLIDCNTATKNQGTSNNLRGLELHGKKFGIIGAGVIGLKTAKLAKAFGCKVYCYRRNKPQNSEFTFTDMDTILKTCDIISLHTPLTPQTKHLINAKKLALMKKTAILINTARGAVVDNNALATALKEGKLFGAGIDVFDTEPPISKDNPLLEAPNVILSPHIGFDTHEAMKKRAIIALENIAKWLDGHPQNLM